MLARRVGESDIAERRALRRHVGTQFEQSGNFLITLRVHK